jgi:hypothetical protein
MKIVKVGTLFPTIPDNHPLCDAAVDYCSSFNWNMQEEDWMYVPLEEVYTAEEGVAIALEKARQDIAALAHLSVGQNIIDCLGFTWQVADVDPVTGRIGAFTIHHTARIKGHIPLKPRHRI